MDIKTYIQELIMDVHSQSDQVMKDMTDEQANWRPSGTLNPIGAIFVHMVGAEDDFIQAVFQHKTPYWEAEGWAQKTAIPTPPIPGHGWGDAIVAPVKIALLRNYEQVVRAATDSYLVSLTPEELERQVYLFGQIVPVRSVLKTLIVHSASHIGEIAAIKGAQGVKGLPY